MQIPDLKTLFPNNPDELAHIKKNVGLPDKNIFSKIRKVF